MNLEIAAVIIGALVFIVIFSLMAAFFRRNVDLQQRIRQGGAPEKKATKTWRDHVKTFESLFKPLGTVIPRSPEEMSRQEKRLVQAGFRRKDAAVLFHGAQLGLAMFFLAV